jgi:hypothetical protein
LQLVIALQYSNVEATQTGGAMALEWQLLVAILAVSFLRHSEYPASPSEAVESDDEPKVRKKPI